MLSEALADRLRIDGTAQGRKRSLLARRQPAPTAEERQQLELIRSSPLFDAAWYLRDYHDVVRSGDEPGLHFLRHPTRPIRAPGPGLRHRPLRRRPPRGAGRGRQPAGALPALGGGQDGPTATRPQTVSGRTPSSSAGRRRCAEFQAALARLRPALAARRPRRPGPRAPAGGQGRSPRACPSHRQAAAARPRRRSSGARWRWCGRAAPSTRRGTSRPTGSPPRRTDPLLHFVDEGWRDLRAPSLDFDLWWYTCTYLDPTAEDVNPLLHYLLAGRHAGTSRCRGRRPSSVPHPLRRGATAAPGLPVRGLRPRRDRRRLRRALPARAGPPRRRVLPRRRRARARRARQARRGRRRGLEHPARGVRLRLLVAAGPRPGRLGPARRLRRGRSSPTTAASWCGPSTTCFAEMDARACDWWSLQATSMEFNEDDVGVDASMPLDRGPGAR